MKAESYHACAGQLCGDGLGEIEGASELASFRGGGNTSTKLGDHAGSSVDAFRMGEFPTRTAADACNDLRRIGAPVPTAFFVVISGARW